MDRILLPFRQNALLNKLFVSNIFLSFHYALIVYVNSSLLNGFFSETQISALYIIGAVLNTFFLLNASKILEKIGLYKFAAYTIVLELLSTIGLAFTNEPFLIGLYFLIHTVVISLIAFNMDIFIENVSDNVSIMGSVRATYMTVSSITFVISPILVSLLVMESSYMYVYIASSIFLLPLAYFFRPLQKVTTPKVEHINIRDTVLAYLKDKNLYNIFMANFLLQLFYAFMVIYVPLYLSKYIGFAWSEIGFLFTIMLLPFILFEVPVGDLADDKYGEKEFLTIGFIIMGLATIFISFITLKVFWIWATVLFITRVGASVVGVASESYFFKKVKADKSDVIGFFRITKPIAYIVAPIIATVALQFVGFQYIFILIGACMILGTRYSLALIDTK